MQIRILSFCTAMILAGCAATGGESDGGPAPVVGPVPPDAGSVDLPGPVQPDPVPGECELLLESLREIRPMLDGLDESMTQQADRIDAAVANLNRPPPAAQAPVCPPNTSNSLGGKEIIGAMEWIYMDPPGQHFQARVNSNADTSSMSAGELVEFERDGEDWVRFNFRHESMDESVELVRPIMRTALIRRGSADEPDRRPVIELDVRLGEQLHTTEFTLTEPGRLNYPVLLGRAFLMDLYIVDVSRSYTHGRYEAGE
jgi:hypothetical protein